MATPREQFIELRKSGKTPVEARQAVMNSVAPSTPVTPIPVPQQPKTKEQAISNVVQDVWWNVKTRQEARELAKIWIMSADEIKSIQSRPNWWKKQENGIQWQQEYAPYPTPAPVATPEGTRTPSGATLDANWVVAPVPVTPTPVTPTTPKPDATPGITQDAFQQAKLESEKIKAQNDAVMAQNKQKSDLATQERQQVAEETKKANMVTDPGAIFNTLKMGGSVPNNNTPEYRQAQSRYNTFKKFTTYDVASLSTALQSGDLLMGTQAFTDLTSDPTMLAKIQRARAFTNGEIDHNAVWEKSGQYVMSNNPSVAQALADGNMTQEEYNQLTNNDEVNTQAKVMTEKKDEYDKYKRQLESIDDEVEAEYADKQVTDTFKSAIKANRDKWIRKLFNSASDEYQNAMGLYTELKNSSTAVLAINMKQYEAEQAKQNQIASEERAVQRSKDALQYEADFNKAQAQEALNDPATQIKSTLDEFAKLGIVAQWDLTSKLAEFKTSGKTLPEYISGLRNQFMSKPEYQKIQALQQGQLSDADKFRMQNEVEDRRDLRNFSQQKEMAQIAKDNARSQFLWELENDPEKKAKVLEYEQKLNAGKSLFDILGKNVGTYEGNRGYDLAGALGDPLPAGGNWTVKSVDNAGEQVGSIFMGGKWSKPYGNTVVMVDENGNEVRYSHLQNIGVKKWDVLGFGDIVGTRGNTGNVMGANGEKLTAEQLKAGRGSHLDVEVKNPQGKLLSNADQVNYLKGLKAGMTGTSWASLPLYRAYMEDNKLPSKDALAWLWMTSEQFTNNASTWYDQFLRSKEKEINSTYPTLQIEFTPSYASLSATQREKLNESMTKIGDIDMRLEKLKKLFNDNWTEVLPTQAKKEMQSLKQQIILKAKEVENLGVLNWPDLWILESLIPETTGIMSGLFSFDDNTNTTLNSIQNNYRSDAKTKWINYGARIGFKWIDEPVQQATPTNTNTGVWQTQEYKGYTIKPF
jgi:murein DD-endopeptidase MepM/ murein hydrolase activator NlpD